MPGSMADQKPSVIMDSNYIDNLTVEIASTVSLGHSAFERIAITSILFLIILLTASGNILVMLAVAAIRWMRTLSNAFVFSLAVADMLVGLFVMPWAVLVQWNDGLWHYGQLFCLVWLSWDVYFSTISIMHFSCLAVDRYLAISDPFRYNRVMTKRTVAGLLILCWVLPGFISFLPILNDWNMKGIEHLAPPVNAPVCFLVVNTYFAIICSCIAFYIPLAAIVFSYCRIFSIARHQARRIHALEVASTPGDDGESPNKSLTRIRKETKAAKTLATIVGAFTACYVPFFTMNVLDPFFDNALDNTPGHKIWIAITWLGYCNSMINPWIYYVSNRSFRAAFRKILCCNGHRQGRIMWDEDNDAGLYRPNQQRQRNIVVARNGHATTIGAAPRGSTPC
ncbi:hypothetical protein CHUAL_002420 [Chamberlinius hualienensis]